MVFLLINYMARYKETKAVILKLFPKTMQVPIINNYMAPHTNRNKNSKSLRKRITYIKIGWYIWQLNTWRGIKRLMLLFLNFYQKLCKFRS